MGCTLASWIASVPWVLAASSGTLLAPALAAAQSCHAPSLRPTPTGGLTYRAALSATFATFDNAAGRGEYQGLTPSFSVAHRWFVAELALPMYRLARVGGHAYGLGDVSAAARANLYRSPPSAAENLLIGPEIAATFPTGRSDDGLGMGHAMLMPGAFLQLQQGSWTLLAQIAYGRALADGGAHQHMRGVTPLVNPMNMSELTHAIGVSAALLENLRATGRLLGAVHVFDHGGVPREIVAPGLQLIAGALDLALEVQVPLLGKPFTSRTVLSAGAQW